MQKLTRTHRRKPHWLWVQSQFLKHCSKTIQRHSFAEWPQQWCHGEHAKSWLTTGLAWISYVNLFILQAFCCCQQCSLLSMRNLKAPIYGQQKSYSSNVLVLCCILCLSPNTTIVVLWIYVYLYVDYYCACALDSSILNNWVNVGHCGVSVSKLHTFQPLKGEWGIKSCWVLVRSQYIVVGSLWWHIVGTSLAGSSIVCHVSLTF